MPTAELYLAQPSPDASLLPGDEHRRGLPQAGWNSFYEDNRYFRLEAWFFVCALHLSFTTFPALGGLYPPAVLEQARLKPLVTLVHGSSSSGPSTGSHL